MVPIIACGLLQVLRCGISSGYVFSTKLIHAGQQDVNIGRVDCITVIVIVEGSKLACNAKEE